MDSLREEVLSLRAQQAAHERRAERLERLHGIIADLGSALVPDAVAAVIIDHGVAAVGAETAGIWLLDAQGEVATLLRARGYTPEAREHFARQAVDGPSPLAETMRTGKPCFLETRAEYVARFPASGERTHDDVQAQGVRAVACLPLGERRPIGALAFGFDGERTFDAEERRFLELLAAHCAQAMQRARTYEAERRASSETALLYTLLDRIAAADTLEQVYEPALAGIGQALDVGRSAILLYDDDGVMRFKAWRGLSETYRERVEGHSPWTRETRNPRPILVPDVLVDPSLAAYDQAFREENIRSLGFIPLVHARRLLGKFMIYSAVKRTFDRRQILVVETIAAQVAQAVARHVAASELARAYAQAEAANRMKDEFLAVVSHELRTPLAAIAGWAALLKTDKRVDPATLAKGIDSIDRNARAQTRIIDDILDVSRIITGKLVLDAKPTSLPPVVVEALESVRASAAAKDIEITFEQSDDPFTVAGDPERLRQIAWNLLSNAVKFTLPGGRVTVRLLREPGTIVLEVNDTGTGIAPEFLPFVFDRFRQADASTTRRQRGLGLGLAIVRHLVELHGGHVRAESAGPDLGATFRVAFPVHALVPAAPANDTETLASAPPAKHNLSGLRVLLVEDEADARDVLREVLVSSGAEVHAAATAREALDVIEHFAPDVVVSDIGMPGQDGFSLIRKVRALDPPYGALPAIALTAYARRDDARGALAAGFQQFLAKPTDPLALTAAVLEAARLAESSPGSRPRSA